MTSFTIKSHKFNVDLNNDELYIEVIHNNNIYKTTLRNSDLDYIIIHNVELMNKLLHNGEFHIDNLGHTLDIHQIVGDSDYFYDSIHFEVPLYDTIEFNTGIDLSIIDKEVSDTLFIDKGVLKYHNMKFPINYLGDMLQYLNIKVLVIGDIMGLNKERLSDVINESDVSIICDNTREMTMRNINNIIDYIQNYINIQKHATPIKNKRLIHRYELISKNYIEAQNILDECKPMITMSKGISGRYKVKLSKEIKSKYGSILRKYLIDDTNLYDMHMPNIEVYIHGNCNKPYKSFDYPENDYLDCELLQSIMPNVKYIVNNGLCKNMKTNQTKSVNININEENNYEDIINVYDH